MKWKSKADQCWQHKKGIASLSFGFYNVKMIKNMNVKWYQIFFSVRKEINIFSCERLPNYSVLEFV